MVVIVCCMCGIIRISFLRFTYAYIIYLFYAIVKPKRCGFHPTRKHVGFRRKFITPCHWLRYLHPPMVTVFPPSSTVTAISFFFVSVVMMALAELVPLSMKRFVKCFFELLTQIIVKVRKCKVQRVCVLHFQLAGSGGCFFLMKLYH